jgi:lipoate synthase
MLNFLGKGGAELKVSIVASLNLVLLRSVDLLIWQYIYCQYDELQSLPIQQGGLCFHIELISFDVFQGFRYVASGPMVRSSYKAGEFFIKAMIDEDREKERIAAIH